MFSVTESWNPKQALLRQIINKTESFEEAKVLLMELHSLVHSKQVYENSEKSYFEEILAELNENNFRIMPSAKNATIAWDIWHITRIEDITSSIFINNDNQIFNIEWQKKLGTAVSDTGNAMTVQEIIEFSKDMNLQELMNYRNAVGRKTRNIIENLYASDMKRKFSDKQTQRVLNEGGVTEHPDSIWLKDFWGKKTVAGIFLMPTTRHQIVHINDCRNILDRYKRTL